MSFVDAIRLATLPRKRAGWVSRLSQELCGLLGKIRPAVFTRPRGLRVEERLALGPKKSLTVVYCRGERFLVASGADTVTAVVRLGGRKRRAANSTKYHGGAR